MMFMSRMFCLGVASQKSVSQICIRIYHVDLELRFPILMELVRDVNPFFERRWVCNSGIKRYGILDKASFQISLCHYHICSSIGHDRNACCRYHELTESSTFHELTCSMHVRPLGSGGRVTNAKSRANITNLMRVLNELSRTHLFYACAATRKWEMSREQNNFWISKKSTHAVARCLVVASGV